MTPEEEKKKMNSILENQKKREQFLQQKKNFQKLKGNTVSEMNRKFYTQIRKRG